MENCCFDHKTYCFLEVLVAVAILVANLSIAGEGETVVVSGTQANKFKMSSCVTVP